MSIFSPLVTLRQGREVLFNNPAVFCVPGAGASVTCFLSLVSAMPPGMNIYGFQPQGLDGKHEPHKSVQEMAEDYVRVILKSVSPGKGCHLIGHSFGGWVCLEVAFNLLNKGINVDSLVLLDVESPFGDKASDRGQYGDVDSLLKLVEILEQSCNKSLGLTREMLDEMGPEEQLNALKDSMIAAGLVPKTMGLDAVRGMVKVFKVNLNTVYQPSASYANDILLVNAEDRGSERDGELSKSIEQWKGFAPGLKTMSVSGNHMSMLSMPHVSEVVKIMQERVTCVTGS